MIGDYNYKIVGAKSNVINKRDGRLWQKNLCGDVAIITPIPRCPSPYLSLSSRLRLELNVEWCQACMIYETVLVRVNGDTCQLVGTFRLSCVISHSGK